jgi:formyl-CoA transferase
LADPQFIARQSIVEVAHRDYPTLKMQNVVPKLSATPGAIRWPGPTLGEHNVEVFGELLGLNEETLADLRTKGIV